MSESIMSNDHIETTFDGLMDMVAGNETFATRYLTGAIWANQCDNELVIGAEGFLGSVGEGIKKAITYILDQIKKLWNWLFGKDEVKVTVEFKKKVETQTKEVEKTVDNAAKPVSEANKEANKLTVISIKHMISKANIPAEEAPSEVIEKVTKYLSGDQEIQGPSIKLKEAYEETLKKLIGSEAYNGRVEKIAKLSKSLKQRAEALDTEETSKDSSLGQIATTVKNGLESGSGISLNVTLSQLTPSNLKSSMSKVRSHMTAMSTNYSDMESSLKHLEKKIEQLQRTVNNTDDKEVKEELQACKKILVAVNEFGGTYKQLRTQLLAVLDMFK